MSAKPDIYIGLDVHKKTYSVVCISEGEQVGRTRMPADPKALIQYIRNKFPQANIHTAYEAGFSGNMLHRELIDAGIDSIVIDCCSMEVPHRKTVKTDHIDAYKLADQLYHGRLRSNYIPSLEEEAKREVSRTLDQMTRMRVRVANQIKMMFHYHGYPLSMSICERTIDQLPKVVGMEDIIKTKATLWKSIRTQEKHCRDLIKEQAKQDHELQKLYTSVPGIGQHSAQILINELGDLHRFSNHKKLCSFAGLTPREHSSGERVWRGGISRQGRPVIRKILVQCAWAAVKCNPGIKHTYEELRTRCGARKAIVAIARRMLVLIRAIALSGQPYQEAT